MNQGAAPPEARAAGLYAMGIRSRRDLLQSLYYGIKNNAAEAWELHRRLQTLQQVQAVNTGSLGAAPLNHGVSIRPGDIMPRHEVLNAKNAAEATAEDSAITLVLMVDRALQRLRPGISAVDTRDLGPEIVSGIRLNRVIWALANQARHLHEWIARADAQLYAQPDVQVIVALKHDPRNENAAREIIMGMNLNSYLAFEEMMIQTARDVLAPTGWTLRMLSAGTYGLDPPPQPVQPPPAGS